MEKELVSIIIPAYNVEKYIGRCLNSLICQSYEKIEIIVVNDGSKDSTGKICDEYAQKDARIKVLHIENGGVSNARNTGLKASCGTYIMFVDSDDYVEADFVEVNYRDITEKQADWGIFGGYFEHPNWSEPRDILKKYEGVFEREKMQEGFLWLYEHGFISVIWNKIYKRELIQKYFRTDMSWGEDMYFNLEYLENVRKISVNAVKSYHYSFDENEESLTKRIGMEKFQNEDILYHRMAKACELLRIKNLDSVALVYAESIIFLLFGVAYSKESEKEKKRIMNEVCDTESVRDVMARVKTKYFYTEWLRLMIKGKHKCGLYVLFVLARIARRVLEFFRKIVKRN